MHKTTFFKKKAIFSVLLFLFLTSFSFSQSGKDGSLTVSASNTVLNRYTRVTADVLAGTNTVSVTDITELNRDAITYLPSGFVTNVAGFTSNTLVAGDLIMLYQAQGAVIDATNTINYGAVSNYNGAGSYELAYVSSVAGNVITLTCNTRLSYYAARYVQVIRIPQYTTLTVNSGATVVAVPWGAPTFGGADPSALQRRRGGFVGILADNIVNNGSINANDAGFRGGTIENNTSGAGASFYTDFRTTDSTLSAEKGESIAGYRDDYDTSFGGRYGRGAVANGGGGGNAHNAGGGGGANGGILANWFRGAGVMNDFGGTCGTPGAWALDPNYIANGNALTNSSGGGSGGYTYASNNIDACTVGPSYPSGFISSGVPAADVLNSGWGGDNRDAVGGLGGRPIVSAGMQSQIFFGGGGGAGDGNNNANADGGDGGGVVFLVVANAISGTGTMQSNGQNGFNTVSGHNDAPGGGGGGGTVLVQANTIANTLVVNTNGGKGGNQLIGGGESEGPGGGGGGGVISVNAVTDTSTKTILGGTNGRTSSGAVTEFLANGATSGNAGSIVAISVNLNSSVCQTDLQVDKVIDNTTPNVGSSVSFTITAKNNGANNATGVIVSDVLPAGYTFVSATTLTGSWTAPNWTIGNLANSGSATLTIVATVNASGSYGNTATITSNLYDPSTGNNTATVTPTINHAPMANDDNQSASPLTEDGVDGTINIITNDTDPDGNPSAPVNGGGQFTVDLDIVTSGTQNTITNAAGVWTLVPATGIVSFNPANNFFGTAVLPYTLCDQLGLCDNADITFLVIKDADSDGVNDNVDLDDDNDGILDTVEGLCFYSDSESFETPVVATVNGNNIQPGSTLNGWTNVPVASFNIIRVNNTVYANGAIAAADGVQYIDIAGASSYAEKSFVVSQKGILNSSLFLGNRIDSGYTPWSGRIEILDATNAVIASGNVVNFIGTTSKDTWFKTEITNFSIVPGTYKVRAYVDNFGHFDNFSMCISTDTDGDGTPNYLDLDSDNDGCSDANEYYGLINADGNLLGGDNGQYGLGSPAVNLADGKVTIASYVGTYSRATTAGNVSTVSNPINQSTTVGGTVTFSVTASGGTGTTVYQWQQSTNNGTTWFNIVNGGVYSNTQTANLTLTGVMLGMKDYDYRALVVESDYVCGIVTTPGANLTLTNSGPVAVDDTYTVTEEGTVTLTPLALDTDVDGDTLSIASINGTALTLGIAQAIAVTNGTVNITAAGVITFTPALNFNSATAISIPYVISDGTTTATANELLTVTAVNDAPIAQNNAYSGLEDAVSITGNVITDTDATAGTDSDLDSATLTVQDYTIAGIAGTQSVGSSVTIPLVGDITILADGSLTFVPVLNYNGTVPTITYTLTDGALTDTADVVLTVTAVNDAPIAQNNAYSGLEDAVSITGNVITDTDATAGTDSDLDSATLTVQDYTIAGIAGTQSVGSSVTIPLVGDITILADGSLTFVPVLNYNGTVPTITYTLTDGALTDTADVVLTVTAVNDAPIAQNNAYSGLEDAVSITGNVITDTDATAGTDSDLDSATLTVQDYTIAGIAGTQSVGSSVTIPLVGDITILADGSLTFVPVLNYNGTVPTITYTLTDGALTDTADVVLTVTAVNDAPIAQNNAYSGLEDAVSITGNVITDTDATAGTDSDLDSATLTVQDYTIAGIAGTQSVGSSVTIPLVGDITILADGSLTFVPVLNYNGTVPTITYTLTDGALTDTADVVLTVTAVNDAPIAQNNAYSGLEDAVSITGNVITDTDATAGTDSDLDSATLTVQDYSIAGIAGTQSVGSSVTIPLVGDITILADGSLTFVPVLNYNGTVPTITYTLTDGALTDTADVVLTVTAVNDAPIAQNNAYSGLEDAVSITGNVITDTDATAGTDSDLDSATLTVQDYTIAGIAGTQSVGSSVTIPLVGDITILADGSLTFVPVLNYNGTVPTITYTLTDGALTDTADVVLTVTAVNDAPIAQNNAYSGLEDAVSITGNVITDTDATAGTDSDLDSATLTVQDYTIAGIAGTQSVGSSVTIPLVGDITILADGSLTFVPVLNYNGTVPTITYTLTDGALTDTADVVLTVTAVNDAPIAQNNAYSGLEDAVSITGNVITDTDATAGTDSDLDSATLTVQDYTIAGIAGTQSVGSSVTIPLVGDITILADGSLTFVPVLNYNGTVPTITYTLTDGALTDTADVVLTVTAVNDAPIAQNNAYSGLEDAVSITGNVITDTDATAGTDSDLDSATLTVQDYTIAGIAGTQSVGSSVTIPLVGDITILADGSLTFVPVLNYNGTVPTITYTLTDGALTDTADVVLTVTAVNDAPIAQNNAYSGLEDAVSITGNVITDTDATAGTDSDLDSATLTVQDYTIAGIAGTQSVGSSVTIPLVGDITILADGSLTFVPVLNYNGTVPTITYTLTDGALTDTADVVLTVTAVNDAPIANDNTNTSIPSTAGATAINGLAASDTDGTIATYTVLSLPTNGTLALSGTAVTLNQVLTLAEAALLTYDPSGTFTGNATFTFTATDNNGAVDATPAMITIPVGNNAPTANDDTNTSIPSLSGATAINALTANDTDGTIATYTVLSLPTNGTLALSGTAVLVNQVLTLAESALLTYDPSGTFTGNATFTFTATDNNGAVDATPATITIEVSKTPIEAIPDPAGPIVGINQVVAVLNVLTNDKLNNLAAVLSDVNLVETIADPTGFMTLKADGTVELAANTPAGSYTLTYSICEKLNPSNCNSAVVTVTVVAPTMTITANSYCSNDAPYVSYTVIADNFTPTGLLTINWIDSANNVVATQSNMPLNGTVLWPGAVVDVSNNPTDWPGWLLVNGQWLQGSDGFELTRPSVTMQFVLNPTQNVTVNYPAATSGCTASPRFVIITTNDNVVSVDGIKGQKGILNVFSNDTFNGLPVNPSDVILTSNPDANFKFNADGTIDALPNIPGGTYTLNYSICEKANPSNCSQASITIFVSSPSIALVKTAKFNDENNDGYAQVNETITYSFEVTNTGNVPLTNITITDPLPGVVMYGTPLVLAVGESNTTHFKGEYSIKQSDINSGSISNQATVYGTAPSGAVVEDKSDEMNLVNDNPTVLSVSGCAIQVFNAVSPDGSGQNDRFYIRGLECYPENSIEIFNRWGVLVFEREHYNNEDRAFRGTSEGRVTLEKSSELPVGTYFYILKYKDSNNNTFEKSGYLYLNRK